MLSQKIYLCHNEITKTINTCDKNLVFQGDETVIALKVNFWKFLIFSQKEALTSLLSHDDREKVINKVK